VGRCQRVPHPRSAKPCDKASAPTAKTTASSTWPSPGPSGRPPQSRETFRDGRFGVAVNDGTLTAAPINVRVQACQAASRQVRRAALLFLANLGLQCAAA
jgi:hypothetical protein